ncbi:hypothetical protein EDB86DRAFT_3073326 [Lactarius hatsudake]|nr:hypothetical protein EDB86DRAFT_3073326 [Lactarius hatsudake]
MGCCSSKTAEDATSKGQGTGEPAPQQQSGLNPAHKSPQGRGAPSYERPSTNMNDKGPISQEKVVPQVAAVSRSPSRQSVVKPAHESHQVRGASPYEPPTTNLDDKGPTSVVSPVARAVSRLPSQQSRTGPARESPDQVGGASSYEPPTTNLDDDGVASQERVVPHIARTVSRLPSQQGRTRPARESSDQVGGASSYEPPTTNLDDNGVALQERVVPPVARAVSRHPSQQSGTKPARKLPQIGGASSAYERPTTNVDDKGPTLEERVVLPVARAVSRLPSQQTGAKPARESPPVGGTSSYEPPTTNLDDRGPTSVVPPIARALEEHHPQRVVPPVAQAVSRLPSQQSRTGPTRESPDQLGEASSYEPPTTNLDDRGPTLRDSEQVAPPVARAVSRLPSQQSGTKQARESPQVGGPSSYRQPTRSAWAKLPVSTVAGSAPQKVDDDFPALTSPGSGVKSSAAQSEHSRAPSKRPAKNYSARRLLNSTVRQILPEDFKFRILVVGKNGSGKSSLIKAVFKVDVTTLGKGDIDAEFCPGDNRYIIVHECSGLDSRASDSQDLQTIRNFISYRTDTRRSPSERLHAIWICVPASDVISGRLGDGVEDILGFENVPVVVVFTKFDLVVSQVPLNSHSGGPQHNEHARARARIEESCRRLFRKDPKDVPAEIVSDDPRFVGLIDNLTVTTDKFITDSRAPFTRSGAQGEEQQIGAVPLAWSAALRVNHDIIIQASIEVGRGQYWRSLRSSVDFADQTLKKCVNILHLDIVEIWNMNDKTRYLSSDQFKAKMSHLVKDLAGSVNGTSGSDLTRAGNGYAHWVNDVYRGSQENVRCVMGYIVNLTVILDGIFRIAAGDMSPSHAQQVFERHARSKHRDTIHNDIRSFITEAFAMKLSLQQSQKDLVLDGIVDLIKQFCVPHSESGNGRNG